MSSALPPVPPSYRGPISVMDGMDQQALAMVYAAAFNAEFADGNRPEQALAAGRVAVRDFRALMVSKVEP